MEKFPRLSDMSLQGCCCDHYSRNIITISGNITFKVSSFRSITREIAIIERYRNRESSMEEELIKMYLTGVFIRRVEDITEAL